VKQKPSLQNNISPSNIKYGKKTLLGGLIEIQNSKLKLTVLLPHCLTTVARQDQGN